MIRAWSIPRSTVISHDSSFAAQCDIKMKSVYNIYVCFRLQAVQCVSTPGRAGTTRWSGTTILWLTPAPSSGTEAATATATASTHARAAWMLVWKRDAVQDLPPVRRSSCRNRKGIESLIGLKCERKRSCLSSVNINVYKLLLLLLGNATRLQRASVKRDIDFYLDFICGLHVRSTGGVLL